MKKNKGFTLIELLAVIVILGILLSISVVAVNKIRKQQKDENRRNVISSILTGAKRYATDNNFSTGTIYVKDLIEDEYVEFDKTEYPDLSAENLTITVSTCSNKYKRMFSIYTKLYDSDTTKKTYNDCGCEEQAVGTAKKICP